MGFLSSLAGPLLGAAIGGISGGKGSTATVDNTPHWYKGKKGEQITGEGQDAYLALLEAVTNNFATPFTPAPTGRVSSGAGGTYGTLFDQPEMMQIQTNSDRAYIDSLMNPPAPQEQMQQQKPSQLTIMSHNPAAQKGGAPGFFLLSDGTQVTEQEMAEYMAKQMPGYRGDIDQGRVIGRQYKGVM